MSRPHRDCELASEMDTRLRKSPWPGPRGSPSPPGVSFRAPNRPGASLLNTLRQQASICAMEFFFFLSLFQIRIETIFSL